jgi:hypothetical protein
LELNLHTLFDPVEGNPGLTIGEVCAALGPPNHPVCEKTVRRYFNDRLDPLLANEIGGRRITFLSVLRAWATRREQRKNPRPTRAVSRKRRPS